MIETRKLQTSWLWFRDGTILLEEKINKKIRKDLSIPSSLYTLYTSDLLLTCVIHMIPICYIRVDSDIDTFDQIVFRMIQYWIKNLDVWRNRMYSFIEFLT